MTPLDHAHAAMTADTTGDAKDAAAQLRFYRLLADATLFLLLETEAQGAQITPRVFPLKAGPVLLAFDSEERLAGFSNAPQAYAALPGRLIAARMAGQGLSLGLNLGSGAPSETLLPPEALDWLMAMLDQQPVRIEARAQGFHPPSGLPPALETALQDLFDGAAGLAVGAVLTGVRYQGGGRGHLLAVLDADPGAEPALARAVAEALAFSGLQAAGLDVVFLKAGDPVVARMAGVARHFSLPKVATAAADPITPPGMDPDRPPRLR